MMNFRGPNIGFLLALTIGCLAAGALSQGAPEAGPYKAVLKSIDPCSDTGKNVFSVELTYDEGTGNWNGVVTKKESMGDNVTVRVELKRELDQGQWEREFTQNFVGLCSLIKAAPEAMMPFLNAMDHKECPFNEGESFVKDLKNEFQIPFMDEMRYGARQAQITLLDEDKNVLGCSLLTGEIRPKW